MVKFSPVKRRAYGDGVYSPISLPRISFMSSEHGTGEHAGTSESTYLQQMSLLEEEGDGRE